MDVDEEEVEFEERGRSNADTVLLFERTCMQYTKRIARTIMMNKHVTYIGNETIRGMYRDIISFIIDEELVSANLLHAPNDADFRRDYQVDLNAFGSFPNSGEFCGREFQSNRHVFQYFSCKKTTLEDVLKFERLMRNKEEMPDIIIMNVKIDVESETMDEYLIRVARIFSKMREILPPTAKVFNVIMPDLSVELPRQTELKMIEAKVRGSYVIKGEGFSVLDLPFYFRGPTLSQYETNDGVRWNSLAVRCMNKMLLGAILHKQLILPF